MLTRQLSDTIRQMEKENEEAVAYMLEQRMTKKEYEAAYHQLRAQSDE